MIILNLKISTFFKNKKQNKSFKIKNKLYQISMHKDLILTKMNVKFKVKVTILAIQKVYVLNQLTNTKDYLKINDFF